MEADLAEFKENTKELRKVVPSVDFQFNSL